MTPSLKTYQNRCRCCLETFADDEKPSPITEFFQLQYFAFTKVELKRDELLSKYVCEYCHMELLRFSVWKKELIEKQQTLYKLLNQLNTEEIEMSDGEINETESEDDDELSISERDEISSTEFNNVHANRVEESSEEEEEPDDTQFSSEHEPDSDFELSVHPRRLKNKPDSSKNSDLRCGICHTTFLARQGLVRHVAFCRPNKIVGRKVERKKKYVLNSDAKYRCFCNERFISYRALNIHRTRIHGKHTNMSWDIIESEQNDNNNARSTSSISKVGNNSKAKPTNNSSPSKKINQSFKCNYCPYRSEDKRTLNYHVRANHEDINGKVISNLECDECFKLFSTTTALRMHIKTVHRDFRPHACLYCKSSFKQLVHLKEHMLAIHKTLHKPYCCACGNSFSTLSALKQHKINDHKDEEEEEFNKNSKEFIPPSVVMPSGEKKYTCVCSRDYPYPSRLLEHQRYCKYFKSQSESVVTKKSSENSLIKKPHKCFKCARAFNQKSNLIRHQKSANHLDTALKSNLKFRCEHCKQKFFSLNGLKKHQIRNSCNIND